MKILITGGDGFIASAYKKKLDNIGYESTSYDLPNYDILDEFNLEYQIGVHDIIIHFAAMADITVCMKNLDKNHKVNIDGTYNVAKYCQKLGKKLVFISTCCVYGNSHDDIEKEEGTEPMAAEPYACSKVAGEYIIRGMPNLDYIILRIGTVYGVGMREALFTYIALNNILREDIVYIDGDGKQTRQLIHIDDLIEGIASATIYFEKGDINHEIINLCGVEHTSALQTAEIAHEIVGKPAKFKHREQRYGQTFKENISIEKAKKLLGWEPKINFFEGMRDTFEKDERFK